MRYTNPVLKHNGLSWASEAHKLIYLGIPKTASSSFRSTFGISNNYLILNNNEYKDYKVFTTIREPINRFISGYLEALSRRDIKI